MGETWLTEHAQDLHLLHMRKIIVHGMMNIDKNWNPKSTSSQLAVLVAVLQIRDMNAYSIVYKETGRKQSELLQRVGYCEYQTLNLQQWRNLNGIVVTRFTANQARLLMLCGSAKQTFHHFFSACLSPQLPLR